MFESPFGFNPSQSFKAGFQPSNSKLPTSSVPKGTISQSSDYSNWQDTGIVPVSKNTIQSMTRPNYVQSKKYPQATVEQEQFIEQQAGGDKYKAMEEYDKFLQTKKSKEFLDMRKEQVTNLMEEKVNTKDENKRKQIDTLIKGSMLADFAREQALKGGVLDVYSKSDNDIYAGLITQPEHEQAFADYLNGDKNLDDVVNVLTPGYNIQKEEPQQEQKGFVGQTVEDIKSRLGNVVDLIGNVKGQDVADAGGVSNYVSQKLLRIGGQVAGGVNDVVGNLLESLIQSTGADKPLGEALNKVLNTDIGKKGIELYSQGADAFANFEAVHPETAQSIKDVWQIAQFAPIPGLASTKVGQQALNAAGDAVETVAKAPLRAVSKILPTAEDTITRLNRMTKGEIASFTKQQGVQPGKWLNDRGFVTAGEDTIDKLATYIQQNMASKGEALAQIKQTFTSPELVEMAKDAARYADETLNPSAKRIGVLANKVNDGLNGSEAQEIISFYQRNNKFDYGKNITASEKSARATNIDNAVREQILKFAEDNGLPGLREINKEIQGTKFILDKLGKNMEGSLGNDYFTLTDYIVGAGTNFDPAAMVIGKVAKSDWFRKSYAKIINKINGHTNIRDKILDIETLKRIQNKKDLDKFLALPYDSTVGNTPNNLNIIPDGKRIVSGPNGSVVEGGLPPPNIDTANSIGMSDSAKSEIGKNILDNIQSNNMPALPETTVNNIGTSNNPIVGKKPRGRQIIEINKFTPKK